MDVIVACDPRCIMESEGSALLSGVKGRVRVQTRVLVCDWCRVLDVSLSLFDGAFVSRQLLCSV